MAKHAIEFSQDDNYNFVECGVANGFTTFFTLREITGDERSKNNFSMHLYDAWDLMQEEHLFDEELSRAGTYSNLNIDTTNVKYNDPFYFYCSTKLYI